MSLLCVVLAILSRLEIWKGMELNLSHYIKLFEKGFKICDKYWK